MENKVMVLKLSSMLNENRRLKRRLKTEGLQGLIPKSEWDHWNESVIDGYYKKYVFSNRL